MSFEIDKDFALLYGIMLGDGCLSLFNNRKKFITITGSLQDDLPFFQEIIHPILKRFRDKDTKIRFRDKYGAIEFNFVDHKLFDFIHASGFPIGKKGPDIKIPESFYQNGLINYVIQGFFATDGSLVLTKNPNKYYSRIEAHAICKLLLKQIYDYFAELGIHGGYYLAKRTNESVGGFKSLFPKYRVQFNGIGNLLLFEKIIGFVNPKHKKRFDDFVRYSNEYDALRFGYKIRKDTLEYLKFNASFKAVI